MAVYRGGVEGQTPGANVTNGTLPAQGDDVLQQNTYGGTGFSLRYDDTHAAHGLMSFRFEPTPGSTGVLLRTLEAGVYNTQISLYFRPDDVFNNSAALFQVRHAGGVIATANVTDTGRLQMFGTSGPSPGQSPLYIFEGDTWYRIELRVQCGSTTSNGVLSAGVYDLDGTEIWSDTATPNNMHVGPIAQIHFGRPSGGFQDGTGFNVDSWQIFTGEDADGLGKPWPIFGDAGQILVPDSDANVGSWMRNPDGGSLASALAEQTAADTIDLDSANMPSTARFRLSAGETPEPGDRTFMARVSRVGPQNVNFTVTLREGGGNAVGGGSSRGQMTHAATSDGWSTVSVPITQSISDYSNLYVEVTANLA